MLGNTVEAANIDPRKTAVGINKALKYNEVIVSDMTNKRLLISGNLHGTHVVKKLLLTNLNREVRLIYSKDHLN